jgi:hypothetical protein
MLKHLTHRRALALQLCAFLFSSGLAWAQFTQVTGTVVDPNGLPYANGTITPVLVTTGSPKFTATNAAYTPPTQPTGLNASGAFILQLADNTQLTPGGTTWTFIVNCGQGCVPPAAGKGSVSFTVAGLTISGSSQNISAQLQAAAIAISIPTSGTFPTATTATESVNTVTLTTVSGTFNAAYVPGASISVISCSVTGYNIVATIVSGGAGTSTLTYTDATGSLGPATGCIANLITVSSAPSFAVVGSGTNPNALLVSGTFGPTGGGTVGANLLSGLTNAAFVGTNGSGTPGAAACTSAQILVGNSSNLAVCQPLTGDSSITNGGVMKNIGLNGVVLSTLLTGPLCNTTTTGLPFICGAGNFPILNQSTTGTASNVSGTPALPNGTTATTQAPGDNSAKLATTAYVGAAGVGLPTASQTGQVPASTGPGNTYVAQTKWMYDARDYGSTGNDICQRIAAAFTAANNSGAMVIAPLNGGNNACSVDPNTSMGVNGGNIIFTCLSTNSNQGCVLLQDTPWVLLQSNTVIEALTGRGALSGGGAGVTFKPSPAMNTNYISQRYWTVTAASYSGGCLTITAAQSTGSQFEVRGNESVKLFGFTGSYAGFNGVFKVASNVPASENRGVDTQGPCDTNSAGAGNGPNLSSFVVYDPYTGSGALSCSGTGCGPTIGTTYTAISPTAQVYIGGAPYTQESGNPCIRQDGETDNGNCLVQGTVFKNISFDGNAYDGIEAGQSSQGEEGAGFVNDDEQVSQNDPYGGFEGFTARNQNQNLAAKWEIYCNNNHGNCGTNSHNQYFSAWTRDFGGRHVVWDITASGPGNCIFLADGNTGPFIFEDWHFQQGNYGLCIGTQEPTQNVLSIGALGVSGSVSTVLIGAALPNGNPGIGPLLNTDITLLNTNELGGGSVTILNENSGHTFSDNQIAVYWWDNNSGNLAEGGSFTSQKQRADGGLNVNNGFTVDGSGNTKVANLNVTGICTGACPSILTATTGTITGTALSAGQCDSGTVAITGATPGQPVSVASTTGALQSGSFVVSASVTSLGTVTVQVCAAVAGTPASLAYNVAVLP